MRNVLLPTDFSENAWNATKYAIELFKDEECVFHLLNTYTPAIVSSRFMATNVGHVQESAVRDNSERGLEELVAMIKKHYNYPKHNYKTISSFSLLVDEIKDIVESVGIDIIITGTKGASGLDEVFMGSNTVRIIKSVKNCPVLAIPQYFDYVSPTEIAFATDFNRFYSLSELQPIIDLAKAFKAVIRIVHVQYEIKALTEIQMFNLNMLRKYLNEVEHYVHTVSELNSVSKTLDVFTKELDIHLLAMLNYQHSYMEKMTREAVVKRMAFHTQIPLLVIPELGMNMPAKSSMNRKNAVMD
ncbi:universal stress protein [Maribacter sp. TH_r10]|uniref:Universal stress protein n=1 Tax=Maribacter luteus TaxID=2594478 RepID=A0A6I2ML26_9FLAO|nr:MULTISPECIES: universal stress protein [Maribacter]MDV7139868.1 universal stress protein [Maribacter sp. TH_r10]MRX63477.1 universal stress protein [Maribacter luteus]|tara:strand:- start:1105 stop:2004 length:900 start_codon:yes stop_codon:yes gene_type:complete